MFLAVSPYFDSLTYDHRKADIYRLSSYRCFTPSTLESSVREQRSRFTPRGLFFSIVLFLGLEKPHGSATPLDESKPRARTTE